MNEANKSNITKKLSKILKLQRAKDLKDVADVYYVYFKKPKKAKGWYDRSGEDEGDMKKYICDLCNGDLYVIKKSDDLLSVWFEFWKIKNPFKISKISYFKSLAIFPSPFLSPFSKDTIEICSNCVNDFKEFLLRKKSCEARPQ